MGAEIACAISVVIVTYQRQKLTRETVRHLLPLLGDSAELLVVDQNPDRDEVLAADSRVRYFGRLPANMVAARNVGLGKARGDIVLFVDDDIIPAPGLLAGHLAAYTDPQVGGVAGRIQEARGVTPSKPDPRFGDLILGWRHADFTHKARFADVMTSRGCNMSFRKTLLERVGGFDPQIAIFRDDTDICFRVRQAGFRIAFEPAAALVHLNAKAGGTRPTGCPDNSIRRELQMYRQHYRHYRDNLYFIVKHFRGWQRARWLADAYRTYVGLSRWPWRLLAKNALFGVALFQAFRRQPRGRKANGPFSNHSKHIRQPAA